MIYSELVVRNRKDEHLHLLDAVLESVMIIYYIPYPSI